MSPGVLKRATNKSIGHGLVGADSELADLEMETRPEDVLAEIDRLQRRALGQKKSTS